MKLRSALLALMLATAPLMTYSGEPAADTPPAEPGATPAGGSPAGGLTAGTIIGVTSVVVITAIAVGSGDDDEFIPATATATGTF